MTEEKAIEYLIEDFGEEEVSKWQERNHILSAPDVLYYADAYGDLEDAILLQAWDKTLPERVHKGLLDSGLDIFEGVNTNDLEKMRCPSCGSDMWEIEIYSGSNYTHREWINDWGDVTGDFVEFVASPDDYLWNADPEEDHAPVLCSACSHDAHYDFPRRKADPGYVAVHYGETDEISGFSVRGNLVRWDFEAYDNMTDLWVLPGGHEGLPRALAESTLTDWLDSHNWTEIAFETVRKAAYQGIGRRTLEREYKRLATEWAEGDETHPDLDFTYVIDFSTFGYPSFFVNDAYRDALLAEIIDLIERRYSRSR
ncbi:hypothetical protein [Halapricum desulfuricans]|nr:hypothetical protein [Halapricum desulfuricans]